MDRQTKILYITELVEMGGGERNLLSIIKNLDREKFQPIVLCPCKGSLTIELERRNIPVIISRHGIAKKLLGFIPIISILSIIRLWKILIREKIDIVHAHFLSSVIFSSIPTKLMKIPLVWTVHGWASGRGIQGLLINFFVNRVLTVSHAVERFINQSGNISAEKIQTIFLGVDLKEFNNLCKTNAIKREFGVDQDVPLVGMIGRFQQVKGHFYFLKAAKEIKKTLPNSKFIIVGARIFTRKADKGYPTQIEKWIREYGLENDVICTGFRNDIAHILANLDVMILPSLRESFGLVLVEAMAVGVPVVSTRSGGPDDIIEHNVSGLLVPVGDPKALGEAVLILLENRIRAKEMASFAKKRVEEFFNIDTQTKKIESVYNELIRSKR